MNRLLLALPSFVVVSVFALLSVCCDRTWIDCPLWPVSIIATCSLTPARSRFRTARRGIVCGLFAIAAAAFPGTAHAGAVRLAIGDRIRVTAPSVLPAAPALFSASNIGKLVSLDADTLSFVTELTGAPTRVGVDQLMRLEVSRGRTRKTTNGAVVGLIVGGVLGLVGSAAAMASDFPNSQSPGPGEVLGLVLVSGGAGFAAGALIGSAFKNDHWESIPLGNLHIGFTPRPRSESTLAMRIRF